MKIFCVNIASRIAYFLEECGCVVSQAKYDDIDDILVTDEFETCDALILRVFNPEQIKGDLKRLRKIRATLPILGLADGVMASVPYLRIALLNAEGDALLHKDDEPELICATVRALVRRFQNRFSDLMCFGGENPLLEVDIRRNYVALAGNALRLTLHERRLLLVLAEHAGSICKRDFVESRIYPSADSLPVTNSFEVFLCRLRARFETVAPGSSVHLQTVHGLGIMLAD